MSMLFWPINSSDDKSEEEQKREFDEDWKEHLRHYKSLDEKGKKSYDRHNAICIYVMATILISGLIVSIVMIVTIIAS